MIVKRGNRFCEAFAAESGTGNRRYPDNLISLGQEPLTAWQALRMAIMNNIGRQPLNYAE
jgi:hypothetical protein